MRIRSGDVRVNQRGAFAFAAVRGGTLQSRVAGERVGAVTFFDQQVGIVANQFRDAATGGLHFHWNGNGVAVVFNEVENRELLVAGGIQRFVEFALAGGAFAARNIDQFVAVESSLAAERRFARLLHRLRELFVVGAGLRCTDRREKLGSGGRRARKNIQAGMAPVRRHLATARCGVVFRADALQQHLVRSDAEHQHQSAVAVVREEPVVCGLENQAGGGENGFVARATDLEEDFILALKLNFAVVEPAGEEHRAIDADEGFAVEAVVARGVEFGGFDFGLRGHRLSLAWEVRRRERLPIHYRRIARLEPKMVAAQFAR